MGKCPRRNTLMRQAYVEITTVLSYFHQTDMHILLTTRNSALLKKEFKMEASVLLIICLKLQFWAREQCLYNIFHGIK